MLGLLKRRKREQPEEKPLLWYVEEYKLCGNIFQTENGTTLFDCISYDVRSSTNPTLGPRWTIGYYCKTIVSQGFKHKQDAEEIAKLLNDSCTSKGIKGIPRAIN